MEINELSLKVSATLSYYSHAQKVIALNVANVNQDGYLAKDADFSVFLDNLSSTNDVKESLENSIQISADSKVNLDDQIAKSEHVAMKYTELSEVYNRYLSLYNIATNKAR